jgi:hypothetical protein
MTDKKDRDYEVGYGKPPKRTRFQPGKCPNLRGRPPRSRSLKDDLITELYGMVRIREGERTLRVTRQQAMIKSIVARAIKGDYRAVDKLLVLMARVIGLEPDQGRTMTELQEEDKEILKGFLGRLQNGNGD